jgi:hypothetical protein
MKTICKLNVYRTALFALLLLQAGCAVAGPAAVPGDALVIHAGTVLHGVNQALLGVYDHYILVNLAQTQYIVTWPGCGGYCMSLIDAGKGFIEWESTGMWMNTSDAAGFVKSAMDNGWKVVDPAKNVTAVLPLAEKVNNAIKLRQLWVNKLLEKTPEVYARSVTQMETAVAGGATPGLVTFVLLFDSSESLDIIQDYAPSSVSDGGE